jgi:hypothetical protein
LGLDTLELDWGTTVIKQLRSSPDAFVQLAFQLAWKNAKKTLPVTYESAQIKSFVAGRTETIRPPSEQSRELVFGWDKASPEEVRSFFSSFFFLFLRRNAGCTMRRLPSMWSG